MKSRKLMKLMLAGAIASVAVPVLATPVAVSSIKTEVAKTYSATEYESYLMRQAKSSDIANEALTAFRNLSDANQDKFMNYINNPSLIFESFSDIELEFNNDQELYTDTISTKNPDVTIDVKVIREDNEILRSIESRRIQFDHTTKLLGVPILEWSAWMKYSFEMDVTVHDIIGYNVLVTRALIPGLSADVSGLHSWFTNYLDIKTRANAGADLSLKGDLPDGVVTPITLAIEYWGDKYGREGIKVTEY